MEYYNHITPSGDKIYLVYDNNYELVEIVNDYIRKLYEYRSDSNEYIKLKTRMLCDYFNYLHSVEVGFLEITLQTLSDFLMYLRCPDGIRLNQMNKAVRSEITLRKYLSALQDFYFYADFDDSTNDHDEATRIYDLFRTKAKMPKNGYQYKDYNIKKSSYFLKELNELNSALLKKIKPIDYNFLSNKELDIIYHEIANDIEFIIILLLGNYGVDISEYAVEIENLLYIEGYHHYIRVAPKYKIKISNLIYQKIIYNVKDVKKLTVKDINSTIKRISQATGINFTSTSLKDKFTVSHFKDNQNTGIVNISYATKRSFGQIITLIRKHTDIEVSIIYKSIEEEFNRLFERDFWHQLDDDYKAHEIRSCFREQINVRRGHISE